MAVTREGGTTDGESHTLFCTATKTVGLVSPIDVQWIGPDDTAITGEEDNLVRSVMTSERTVTVILEFSPLSTSHAGQYTCRAELETAALSTPLMESITVDLPVQSKE